MEPAAEKRTNCKRDLYLEELATSCKHLVEFTRKKFRSEHLESETSENSCPSDDSHMIFYNSFLKYPIKLDGKHGKLQVSAVDWAEAFLKYDLKLIATVLCEALFTEEDLQRVQMTTSRKDKLNQLDKSKKAAIARAAKWMMNKNRDPWSYTQSG